MAGSGGLDLITRDQAIKENLKFFYIGSLCSRGHDSKRFVSNYGCYECSKQRYYSYIKTEKAKAVRKLQSKRDYNKNKSRYFKNNAVRRAVCKQATPKWLTAEHLLAIKEMFDNRPDGYHVDHIVPLNSSIVCGLNVPWNLCYLKAEDNLKK